MRRVYCWEGLVGKLSMGGIVIEESSDGFERRGGCLRWVGGNGLDWMHEGVDWKN